ncbi:hypothetical protein U1872_03975 [Sphingomonas sp. RB3P16]
MPGITATELAYAVRDQAPERAVLTVSGYAETTGSTPPFPG